MANDIGALRRSAVLSTYGPGAVGDFRSGGSPISVVLAGLEEWDRNFPPIGVANPQAIFEPRLQRKLGVRGFRLPPICAESTDSEEPDTRRLIGVRFPRWLQCPGCDLIAPEDKWAHEPGRPERNCPRCTRAQPGERKVFVIPVRFIMACKDGHLDEFPWHAWVGHLPTCPRKKEFLKLESEGPGLAGIVLKCPECKAKRSMDGVFSASTWKDRTCRGHRHWLGTREEGCESPVRVVQRGASNLYFPIVESALSIPPWSDHLQEALGNYWADLEAVDAEDRATLISNLGGLKPVLDELGLTPQSLAEEIERRVRLLSPESATDIRQEEYRQFTMGTRHTRSEDKEFETRVEAVPDDLAGHLSRIVRVVRLREVRAITGFTRILAPRDPEAGGIARISREKPSWLPAIEVRGEGIFIELDPSALESWEAREDVRARTLALNERRLQTTKTTNESEEVTPRFLLLHALAHALMRQLTLSCGYSTAALSERLYAGQSPDDMAGALIFTSTTDADGTLGGLQREGRPERLNATLVGAIKSMEWCSSDPLCIEGAMSADRASGLAACHGCLLAPETACEEFNQLLDRAMLVGTPEKPNIGYFRALIEAN